LTEPDWRKLVADAEALDRSMPWPPEPLRPGQCPAVYVDDRGCWCICHSAHPGWCSNVSPDGNPEQLGFVRLPRAWHRTSTKVCCPRPRTLRCSLDKTHRGRQHDFLANGHSWRRWDDPPAQ
jgi:hypothetical protein